ncbi:MAG: 1-(5-phosphoribosyl)-5-[(5-phosphoribosylamino)methylideneamino]imidazole-4-carboxamide isomerase [Saprospiraceae bacterium]|nr:1-(5-phosphoribosyl)-5-[(5-phosphoribosylamino)methylideneamino]imidazole-4-carboxamide isomerase [Saprospiraceae bacterium]
MIIIPAIDLIDGKCVRLTQGDYAQKKIYNEDPLEVALRFQDSGLKHLHLVDLDGAKAGHIINYRVLEKLATHTAMQIDFGGGLQSDEDLRIAFECGAKQITGGTIAVKAPETFLSWLEQYGSERIILGADFKNGNIAVSGWQEETEQALRPFIEHWMAQGVRSAICTDVSKDGLLQGSSVDTYRVLTECYPELKLIASGGVSSLAELETLRDLCCYGAIVGKAFYEGKILLTEISLFL